MNKDPVSRHPNRHWFWLLLLPWIAMVWVPSYNRVEPQLWGFPFFYWYQLLWVLISAIISALVYFMTRGGQPTGRGAEEP